MSHGLKNSKPIQLKGKRNSRGQEKRCPKKRPKKEYSKERSHMNCQYATKLTHHNPTLCGKAAAWLPSFCGEPCPCCMTTAGLALLASRSRQIEGEQNCGWERHSSSLGTQAPKPKAAHCHAPLKPPPHHSTIPAPSTPPISLHSINLQQPIHYVLPLYLRLAQYVPSPPLREARN